MNLNVLLEVLYDIIIANNYFRVRDPLQGINNVIVLIGV